MSLRYWIAASRWFGMGPTHLLDVLGQVEDIEEVFTCTPEALASLHIPQNVIATREQIDWRGVDEDMAWAQQSVHQKIIAYNDPDYPQLLKHIPAPPLLLYIRGQLEVLQQPSLAIVGTRHPSAMGKEMALAFAESCVQVGLGVISGLAQGIDACAHRGALSAGGITLGVLGSGLDCIYPKQNQKLAEMIVADGLMISEFSPKMKPHSLHFPRRNRIISGLSIGVVVVEAALRSGSLITARYASEQGREVFAIPGSIYSNLARGCHSLIRQGAKLVESIQDICEELSSTVDFLGQTRQDHRPTRAAIAVLSPLQRQIWQALDDAPSTLDQLMGRCELSLTQLQHELMQLQLLGYIESVTGGYQRNWI